MIHWANDKAGQTACQLRYERAPERSKDFTTVTCPECLEHIRAGLNDLLNEDLDPSDCTCETPYFMHPGTRDRCPAHGASFQDIKRGRP